MFYGHVQDNNQLGYVKGGGSEVSLIARGFGFVISVVLYSFYLMYRY